MPYSFPLWTLLPFATLVLGIASLPLLFPNAWGKHGVQAAVALGCAAPVVGFLLLGGHEEHLAGAGARVPGRDQCAGFSTLTGECNALRRQPQAKVS